MKKSLVLVSVLLTLFGLASCTATRHETRSHHQYVPPVPVDVPNQKTYSEEFHRVWEAIISYFAVTYMGIQTLEKDSGIIVAQKMIGSSDKDYELVDSGTIKTTVVRRTETLKPKGLGGSVNPAYIREHGKVVATDYTVLEEYTKPALFDFIVRSNVFARRKANDVVVLLNLSFEPVENSLTLRHIKERGEVVTAEPDGPPPRVVSTGAFEKAFFDYLDKEITSY